MTHNFVWNKIGRAERARRVRARDGAHQRTQRKYKLTENEDLILFSLSFALFAPLR
jgi:hypothetical protein